MFKTNTEKIVKDYNRRLNQMGSKGIPMTATFTLNEMAKRSMDISRRNFKRDRVIRSSWAERGILFQQTRRGIPIRMMESRSGSIRDFGDIQEHGGTIRANKKFLPIPSLASRTSGSKGKRIAKKFNMPIKARRLPNIGGSLQRRFAAMLNWNRRAKYYGPFLITNEEAGSEKLPRGIFELRGQDRNKRGGGKIVVLRKMKELVKVPGNPYIAPAGIKIGKKMDRIYINRARFILRKYGRDIR